jgi:hypothetical protein
MTLFSDTLLEAAIGEVIWRYVFNLGYWFLPPELAYPTCSAMTWLKWKP